MLRPKAKTKPKKFENQKNLESKPAGFNPLSASQAITQPTFVKAMSEEKHTQQLMSSGYPTLITV